MNAPSSKELVIEVPPEHRDPGGAGMRGALEAHMVLERVIALRNLLICVLAAAGAPLAVLCQSPTRGSPELRHFALLVWGTSVLGLAVALAFEWRLRRRRSALVAELGARRLPDA